MPRGPSPGAARGYRDEGPGHGRPVAHQGRLGDGRSGPRCQGGRRDGTTRRIEGARWDRHRIVPPLGDGPSSPGVPPRPPGWRSGRRPRHSEAVPWAPSPTARAATGSAPPSPGPAASWCSGPMPRSRASCPRPPASTRSASCTPRTVFDPLAIITASGGYAPYLAQSITPNSEYTSWTVTLRPNLRFHDGTPCDGAALLQNFKAHRARHSSGRSFTPILENFAQTGPLTRAGQLQVAVGGVSVLPGGRHRGPDRVPRGTGHARQPQRHRPTHRDRAVRLRQLGPQRPLHRHAQPQLLAERAPAPRLDHLPARSPTPNPLGGAAIGNIDIIATDLPRSPSSTGQPAVVLHRRQRRPASASPT